MNALSFFQTETSVWTSENFQKIFLENYIPVEKSSEENSILSSDLQDIPAGRGVHEFVFQDPDVLLEQLAGLIQSQLRGEDGELLNNSSANYFFSKGKDGKHYSILVRWEPAQKLWRCGAYLQEELELPNIRLFYPQ
jgi:hypothetical protein